MTLETATETVETPSTTQATGSETIPPKPAVELSPKEQELQTKVEALEKEKAASAAQMQEAARQRDEAVRQTVRLVEAIEAEARREVPVATKPESADEFRDRWEQDPQKVLEEHVNKRIEGLVEPAIQRNMQAHATTLRELERGKLKADPLLAEALGKYEKEMEEFLQPMGDEVASTPGNYTNALAFSIAKRVLNTEGQREVFEWLKQKFGTERKPPYIEGSSAPGPGPSERPQMSDLERHIAREMEVSDEDWLAMKGEHARLGRWQGEKG